MNEVDGAASDPLPDVSVVIPTFNRASTLDRCLDHLAKQTTAFDRFEVIVADDASVDSTHEVVQSWMNGPMRVRYVRCAKVFAGGARNRGVEMARAEVVLFLGDDILATPDLLTRHLDARAGLGDGAVLVGEVRYDHSTRLTPFMRFLEEEGVHHDFPRLRALGDAPISGRYFYACNASLSTERFREVGGFDERLRRAWEDSELGLRLEDAGATFHFLPEPTGLHVHPATLPSYLGFLRRGRTDMVMALRDHVARGGELPRPSKRTSLDNLPIDWVIGLAARTISWTDRALPDRVRRRAYKAILRRERARMLVLARAAALDDSARGGEREDVE